MTEEGNKEEAQNLFEQELNIPTFQRGKKRKAHEKLREEAGDRAKLGGSYSVLNPMQPKDLTGTGVVTRPVEPNDIKTVVVDKAIPGLTRNPANPNT